MYEVLNLSESSGKDTGRVGRERCRGRSDINTVLIHENLNK